MYHKSHTVKGDKSRLIAILSRLWANFNEGSIEYQEREGKSAM